MHGDDWTAVGADPGPHWTGLAGTSGREERTPLPLAQGHRPDGRPGTTGDQKDICGVPDRDGRPARGTESSDGGSGSPDVDRPTVPTASSSVEGEGGTTTAPIDPQQVHAEHVRERLAALVPAAPSKAPPPADHGKLATPPVRDSASSPDRSPT